MIIHGPTKSMGYLCFETKRWVILYIQRKETPDTPVLQRGINCLNRENENRGFRENIDFDV